jgi:hypothetical protein
MYAGAFIGSVELAGLSLISVTGIARTMLTVDDSGQHLRMEEGLVEGADQSGNSFAVELTGSINCLTNQVEEGRLENGVFRLGSTATDLSFNGTVQGDYFEEPYSLVGTWTVEALDIASLLTGGGTWSISPND